MEDGSIDKVSITNQINTYKTNKQSNGPVQFYLLDDMLDTFVCL